MSRKGIERVFPLKLRYIQETLWSEQAQILKLLKFSQNVDSLVTANKIIKKFFRLNHRDILYSKI